ncbi:MAG: hypothetical protein ACPGQ5_05645 [Alphaproteobacteria bacterium]
MPADPPEQRPSDASEAAEAVADVVIYYRSDGYTMAGASLMGR